ncbi:MAG: CehA/McbA family metallohydrolase [Planctomycetia bacterium]|nr:CehA/McbA family metallohydrolase [Planctomycetia bacterium]
MNWRRPLLLALLFVPAGFAHDLTREAADERRREVEQVALAQADPAAAKLPLEQTAELAIRLVDDQGRLLPALVRITNADDGRAIQLPGEIHRALNWFSLHAETKLRLPRRKLRIEAVHGLETERATAEVDLTHGNEKKLELRMRRIFHAHHEVLRSGNTHLHLKDMSFDEMHRYLMLVPKTDGLDIVFVSHLERKPDDKAYISNVLTAGDLARLSQSGTMFGNGEEHRHNFGPGDEGYGHVMFLNIQQLIQPVSIGPGIMRTGTDAPALRPGIEEARRQGATVIWCHNRFGLEDVPSWLGDRLHAQNINDGGAHHGSYDETYYRYLNIGLKVPFSTGTDWFIDDFSRVYVPDDNEAQAIDVMRPAAWLKQLERGRTTITNGPLLKFSLDFAGKETQQVGDELRLDAPRTATLHARGIGRHDFRAIEVVYNGRVVRTVPTKRVGEHFVAELDGTPESELELQESGWLALRIPDRDQPKHELDRALFAHTSPIYVEIGDKKAFHRPTAELMLAEMRRALDVIPKRAAFANDDERRRVLEVYREGIKTLEARMQP